MDSDYSTCLVKSLNLTEFLHLQNGHKYLISFAHRGKKMEDLNIAGEGVDGEKQLKENVSYWKGISAAKT